MDEKCYKLYTNTVEKADNWLKDLDKLHHQVSVVASGQTGGTLNSAPSITTFTGNASQNIYEFLDDFEAAFLHIGSDKQRAERLYRTYLPETIRLSCMQSSDSYSRLREWLVNKYGSLSVVLNQMVTLIESAKKPTTSNNSDWLVNFSVWARFFFRADQLSKRNNFPGEEVNGHLSSVTVLERLLTALPEADEAVVIGRF